MQTDIAFMQFEPQHVAGAVALSRAAGWPHRAEDWQMVLELSNGIVALANGRVVATALATRFGRAATTGMIIVDETMRGRGLGRKIMEATMQKMEPEEWRLIATADGLPLYHKLGFETCGEIIQFQGTARARKMSEDTASLSSNGLSLSWADIDDLATLTRLDCVASGMTRTTLIHALLQNGRILCLKRAGDIHAWAAIRPFGRGKVAGPIIARDITDTHHLLAKLVADHNGQFLRIDTAAQTGLAGWLSAHGLEQAGSGIAMRRGTSSFQVQSHHTYALASQALG